MRPLLEQLDTAERAWHRHRAAIASGERERGLIRAEPGCGECCRVCDLICSVIRGVADDVLRDIEAAGGTGQATVH